MNGNSKELIVRSQIGPELLQRLSEQVRALADMAHGIEVCIGNLDEMLLSRPDLKDLQHADALKQLLQDVASVLHAMAGCDTSPQEFSQDDILANVKLDDVKQWLFGKEIAQQNSAQSGDVQFF